jgi:tetratricopeptide (TPR) repeat protein
MKQISDIAQVRQELARTYNNLGRLLRRQGLPKEAQTVYEQAIQIHESLIQQVPDKREYMVELATFYNNLAILLEETGQLNPADQKNQQALDLLQGLAQPVAGLGLQLAQAHNTRGRLLESEKRIPDAEREYEEALKGFEALSARTNSSDFHLMFGQALFNLAALRQELKNLRSAADLLSQAVIQHLAANSKADLGYDYLLLAQIQLDLGSPSEARTAAENLSSLLPQLAESDRSVLSSSYTTLRNRLR